MIFFLFVLIEYKLYLVNLEFQNEIFIFKDEVNSSQRNHASSWLRKVAVSMHFGIDTYALSVELLDRFLATLKVCFEIFIENIFFKTNICIGSSKIPGMFGCWLFVYSSKMQRRR